MDHLQQTVAASADVADQHAPVPTLLLELQAQLGALSAAVAAGTERGRRPFRPDADWSRRLGGLAYGMFLLADQSGVDLARAVAETAHAHERRGRQLQDNASADWPFGA